MSKINSIIKESEKDLKSLFDYFDDIRFFNQRKILKAMQDHNLSHTDFYWPNGYGYGDYGREKTEDIYSQIFKGASSLVRSSIGSGTHALAIVLLGILLPGQSLLSISGRPYDTMQQVIGIVGNEAGSLKELGISYKELSLKDGKIDIESINSELLNDVDLVLIQRSMGYDTRPSHSVEEMAEAIKKIKSINQDLTIMVDNCYGEFTNIYEPLELGADIIAGSLIKNPGGGITSSGGYIVGKEDLIDRCANRLSSPGLGKETGLSYGMTLQILQGLFYAPIAVNNALKGACLIGHVFDKLGYEVMPKAGEKNRDIVQAIILKDSNKLIDFCQGVQSQGAVGSHISPIASEMPGYEDQVIMASSGFIDGSSIEISADGPLREPFTVFYQGGTSYDQCVFVLEKILNIFKEKSYI